MDSKVIFAQEWYEKGKCPGCGSSLSAVAGVKSRHYIPGSEISIGGKAIITVHTRTTNASGMKPDDKRLCPWTSDDLTSLVLIGSGRVKG
jgi:hypothetical protein